MMAPELEGQTHPKKRKKEKEVGDEDEVEGGERKVARKLNFGGK